MLTNYEIYMCGQKVIDINHVGFNNYDVYVFNTDLYPFKTFQEDVTFMEVTKILQQNCCYDIVKVIPSTGERVGLCAGKKLQRKRDGYYPYFG